MEIDTEPTRDSAGTTPAPLTRKAVEDDIIDVLDLDRDTVTGDTDLLDHGLDSIRAMYLVDKWQAMGVDIQFLELAEESTINAWWRAIELKMLDQGAQA
jgi:bifunctional isochorismate lyase/aryl carrier protein